MLKEFDPIETYVSKRDIRALESIAKRARALLRGRTGEQVREAQRIITDWIHDYLAVTLEERKDELKRQAHEGNHYALEFFNTEVEYQDDDDRYGIVHVGSFKEEMVDEMDILTEGNASEIDVLAESIDAEEMSSPAFQDANEAEFFAALALKYVELSIDSLRRFHDPDDDSVAADAAMRDLHSATQDRLLKMGRTPQLHPPIGLDLQRAIDCAVEAMEAVVNAEALAGRARLMEHLSKVSSQAISKALTEKDNTDAQERKRKSHLLLEKRHAKSREAEQLVVSEWARNPSAFISASQAAEHFTRWLTENGHKASFRTVYDWIRKHARQANIKLR